MFAKDSNRCILTALILSIMLIFVGISAAENSAIDGMALLVERTPANGGIVSPDAGVHSFMPGQAIKITATPKTGYNFVYWLGSVENPTESSTTITLDSPKIVIAVFERTMFGDLTGEQQYFESSSAGGLVPSKAENFSGGISISSIRSAGAATPEYAVADSPVIPDPIEPPFPGIPEPATTLFLFSGIALVLLRK